MLAQLKVASEHDRLVALRSYEVLDTLCETAFDNIVHLAANLTESPICLVSFIDADRQWFKARVGLDASETPRELAFCAHAILEPGAPMIVPDARLDPRFANNPLVAHAPHIRFYAGMPLVNPEGAALGTLCIIDDEPRHVSSAHIQILIRLAETVMTTLELRRATRQIRRLALIDMLTGIANRSAFLCAVEQAIARQRRHGESFAVLYLDLDGFKQVNDCGGHLAGDEVLREVAGALSGGIRAEDMVARLGGDEFAVLLAAGRTDALSAAQRIRIRLQGLTHARDWAITASIGAVTFLDAPLDVDEVIAAADRAMYRAKSLGKDRIEHRLYE